MSAAEIGGAGTIGCIQLLSERGKDLCYLAFCHLVEWKCLGSEFMCTTPTVHRSHRSTFAMNAHIRMFSKSLPILDCAPWSQPAVFPSEEKSSTKVYREQEHWTIWCWRPLGTQSEFYTCKQPCWPSWREYADTGLQMHHQLSSQMTESRLLVSNSRRQRPDRVIR